MAVDEFQANANTKAVGVHIGLGKKHAPSSLDVAEDPATLAIVSFLHP